MYCDSGIWPFCNAFSIVLWKKISFVDVLKSLLGGELCVVWTIDGSPLFFSATFKDLVQLVKRRPISHGILLSMENTVDTREDVVAVI